MLRRYDQNNRVTWPAARDETSGGDDDDDLSLGAVARDEGLACATVGSGGTCATLCCICVFPKGTITAKKKLKVCGAVYFNIRIRLLLLTVCVIFSGDF